MQIVLDGLIGAVCITDEHRKRLPNDVIDPLLHLHMQAGDMPRTAYKDFRH
jgi:hypothetical protein